ncbi:MAG: hypothetical protein LBI01_00360 [Elusimicrobium sp.]|jgi:hypothetical protein|nr:hypothetical protein [Elusimicrobium sp.]
MGLLLLFFCGVVFTAFGFYILKISPLYSKKAITLDALVVDYAEGRDREGKIMYSAVIEYCLDGQPVRVKESTLTSWKPKIGKKIKIKINSAEPEKPTRVTFFNYLFPWFFIIYGILSSCYGAARLIIK